MNQTLFLFIFVVAPSLGITWAMLGELFAPAPPAP
jgi:hypothetical protein